MNRPDARTDVHNDMPLINETLTHAGVQMSETRCEQWLRIDAPPYRPPGTCASVIPPAPMMRTFSKPVSCHSDRVLRYPLS